MNQDKLSEGDDGRQRHSSTPGRLQPNGPDCRARDAGFGDYIDCLVSPDLACSFGLPFGNGRLCMHPARAEIVARTLKLPPDTPPS